MHDGVEQARHRSEPAHRRGECRDNDEAAANGLTETSEALAGARREHLLEASDLQVPRKIDDDDVRARAERCENAECRNEQRNTGGKEALRHRRERGKER